MQAHAQQDPHLLPKRKPEDLEFDSAKIRKDQRSYRAELNPEEITISLPAAQD